MSVLQVQGLFTAAPGLQAPWEVDKVELNSAKRRIDFEVACEADLPWLRGAGTADPRPRGAQLAPSGLLSVRGLAACGDRLHGVRQDYAGAGALGARR